MSEFGETTDGDQLLQQTREMLTQANNQISLMKSDVMQSVEQRIILEEKEKMWNKERLRLVNELNRHVELLKQEKSNIDELKRKLVKANNQSKQETKNDQFRNQVLTEIENLKLKFLERDRQSNSNSVANGKVVTGKNILTKCLPLIDNAQSTELHGIRRLKYKSNNYCSQTKNMIESMMLGFLVSRYGIKPNPSTHFYSILFEGIVRWLIFYKEHYESVSSFNHGSLNSDTIYLSSIRNTRNRKLVNAIQNGYLCIPLTDFIQYMIAMKNKIDLVKCTNKKIDWSKDDRLCKYITLCPLRSALNEKTIEILNIDFMQTFFNNTVFFAEFKVNRIVGSSITLKSTNMPKSMKRFGVVPFLRMIKKNNCVVYQAAEFI